MLWLFFVNQLLVGSNWSKILIFVTCIRKIQYKSLVIVDLDTSFVLSNVNMLREWPKDTESTTKINIFLLINKNLHNIFLELQFPQNQLTMITFRSNFTLQHQNLQLFLSTFSYFKFLWYFFQIEIINNVFI